MVNEKQYFCSCYDSSLINPTANGFLLEVVDNEWRQDELPFDHVMVPFEELPDPEADNSDPLLTISEQEQKWNDLALTSLVPELAISDQISGA